MRRQCCPRSPTRSLLPPERLVAEEFGIRPREPDILQHSVVERSEPLALARAPAPFAQVRDGVVPSITQCENRVMVPRPAPGGMPLNRCHINFPKVGEGGDVAPS